MDPSLSLVLPVYNAQQQLPQLIAQVLDVLPDLTNRFEVVIIDNGSTDQTEEVIHEIARDYPQIRVLRHGRREQDREILQTAMSSSTGDVVLVQEENAPLSSAELQQLWQLRHDRQLIMARAESAQRPVSPHLMDRLSTWGDKLRQAAAEEESSGIQMIRREAVGQIDGPARPGNQLRVIQATRPRYRVWR